MPCSTHGTCSAGHAQAECSAQLPHSEHHTVPLNACVEDTTIAMELGGPAKQQLWMGLEEADLLVSIFRSSPGTAS